MPKPLSTTERARRELLKAFRAGRSFSEQSAWEYLRALGVYIAASAVTARIRDLRKDKHGKWDVVCESGLENGRKRDLYFLRGQAEMFQEAA